MKRKEKATVIRQEEIAGGIYSMWMRTDLAAEVIPGQFISVYPLDSARLLPRPISVCETDLEKGALRIVYRVAGKGTEEFSGYSAGHEVDILGPLGNGFPLERAKGKRAFLIGGGIGIPPLLALAKELDCEKQIILGYQGERYLHDEMERLGSVHIATEDGSAGVKGNVLDAIMEKGLEADILYACGPMPMLRALKHYAEKRNMEAWISLEERMACGVGACLGCVCKTVKKDSHSNVKNARVCTEGPVFDAREVDI